MGKLIRKATGLTVGMATLLAGLLLPMTASAESASPIDASPIIHYSFDNALTSKTIANEGSAANSDATLSGDATVANGQINLTGSQTISVPTTAIAGKGDVTVSIWLKNNYGNGNTAAAYIGAAKTGNYPANGYWLLNPANPSGYAKSVMTNATAADPNNSPWGTEVGPGSTNAATTGTKATSDLALYTTVISGTNSTMSFYLNGKQVGDVTYTIPAGGLTNYGDLVAYIGKSSYADPNSKLDVDDYAVYDTAISAADVTKLYDAQVLDKAEAAVKAAVPASATEDFALPTSAAGVSIAWKSDNAAIAVDNATGKATVTRPAATAADAEVILTATFGNNAKTADYTVLVPKQLSDAEQAKADLDVVTIEDSDDIRSNFSVPTKGNNGSTISWEVTGGKDIATLGEGVNDKSRTVTVKRPAAGSDAVTVTLKAIAKYGTATETKTFTVTIQPMPAAEEKDEAYVWAFFTGEGVGGEKISLAASKGNDALDWNTLNNGTPLFTSEFGEKGLRDPFIMKSKDGDKFYMLATDLKIDGRAPLNGLNGFAGAQANGSKYIEIWKSDDLVNWSKQSHVKVSSDYAGNTWAPEAYYDEEIGKYVVYWASNLYDNTDENSRKQLTYNRMVYVTTDDFVNFSDPTVWIDVDRRGGAGSGSIDVTVQKVGDTYYRIYKDENTMSLRQEKSTDLTAAIGGAGVKNYADALKGSAWSEVATNIGKGQANGYGKTFTSGEGPSLFKANDGDVNGYQYYLFADQPSYHQGPNHYVPMATEDIASGQWTVIGNKMPEVNFPTNSDGGKPRHGTVLPVTRAQYQKVLEAYAPAVAVKSVDALSAETTVGVAPTLPETAHLTHADGSVSDVAVEWDAIDAASYAKTGTFTVKGVAQDDSRMPVEATVTVTGTDISGAVVTAEPNEFTADGAAKEPAVTVTLDGATLKEGADYTVAYTNNIEPGTATVTVTGAGKYSGTASATFTIKAGEPGSTLDKSKLQALVDKVKGYNKADYQSGWDAFAAALADAKQVLQSSTDQQEVDKALSRLQSAADKLVKKSGDSGKTDGKDDGTQKPAAKPGSALSNTGASVFGVGITAVILLAAAGAAYAFRKRRA